MCIVNNWNWKSVGNVWWIGDFWSVHLTWQSSVCRRRWAWQLWFLLWEEYHWVWELKFGC